MQVPVDDISVALALKLRANIGYKPTWCYRSYQRCPPVLRVPRLLLWMLQQVQGSVKCLFNAGIDEVSKHLGFDGAAGIGRL